MSRHQPPSESSQSIFEMVDELTRQEIATWYKDGRLTPHGRQMAKFRQHHADYVNYFIYQYYRACSEVHIETLPAAQQPAARKAWEETLRPFKRREPWLCPK